MFHTTRLSLLAGAVCTVAALSFLPRAQAQESFSWSNSTFNANYQSTQPTAATVAGTSTAGNTVKVSFDSGSYFATNAPSPHVGTYNATANTATNVSPIYANGGTTNNQALQILADFDNGSATAGVYNSSASILVTVFFTQAVQNVSFNLYDVDNGTVTNNGAYNDKITNISATGRNGMTFVPTSLTYNGTTTTSATGDTTSITSALNSNQDSGNANATVNFGTRPLTQFSFTYTDTGASGTAAHSTIQIIALGGLQFTTVPEPSTWACFAVAGGLGIWTLRRRARRQV